MCTYIYLYVFSTSPQKSATETMIAFWQYRYLSLDSAKVPLASLLGVNNGLTFGSPRVSRI